MTDTPCPADDLLLPFLAGDTVPGSVVSHLETCASCQRRLGALRTDLTDLRSAIGNTHVQALGSPRGRPAQIGKYLVVGALDAGGQALVYRALHPTLDKEMVIKLSRQPIGPDSDHRHLLIAEGKLLASLEHPNLARIYDLDFHDDRPFLAMEYVRGQNLQQCAKDERPSPRRAAELVAEVARALAVVHRQGVIHQDIKPANIMIDPDGRARLIDFGLARLRHAWDDCMEAPSGGTPAFMAPEQARGDLEAVGPRSDVFGLGAVLYFLLTGDAPFKGETPGGTLQRAARCEFDRSALNRPGIPKPLAAICLRAMAATPAMRFANAEQFAEELERYARRPQLMTRGALAAAAAVFLAFGAWALWPKPELTIGTIAPALVADLTIEINRGDNPLALNAALPLNTNTDRLRAIGKGPLNFPAVLLHRNTAGKVERLPVGSSPGPTFTRHVYPAGGGVVPFDPGTSGTEVLLLCVAPTEKALLGLDELMANQLAKLPALPPRTTYRLTPDEPQRQGSTFGKRELSPTDQVEWQLDQLRQKLLNREITAFCGVAFAHGPRSESP